MNNIFLSIFSGPFSNNLFHFIFLLLVISEGRSLCYRGRAFKLLEKRGVEHRTNFTKAFMQSNLVADWSYWVENCAWSNEFWGKFTAKSIWELKIFCRQLNLISRHKRNRSSWRISCSLHLQVIFLESLGDLHLDICFILYKLHSMLNFLGMQLPKSLI